MILCSVPRLTTKDKLRLEAACQGDSIIFSPYEAIPDHEVSNVEILITYGYDINSNMLDKMQSLKWIHILQTGIEHLNTEEIHKRKILLSHTKDVHGIPISEYVLSMVLYSARDIQRYTSSKEAGFWDRRELAGEAYGKTVAVFGTGSVGTEIAKLLKALQMNVIGVNTRGSSKEHFDEMYTLRDKHQVLAKSDYVVLILPLTNETHHCIAEEELKIMKESSFLINVGRGPLVKKDALIEALSHRFIKGAALDVFDQEPLPEGDPLWNLTNLFITPHIASLTDKYIQRATEKFTDNYYLFQQGEQLNNQIKPIQDY